MEIDKDTRHHHTWQWAGRGRETVIDPRLNDDINHLYRLLISARDKAAGTVLYPMRIRVCKVCNGVRGFEPRHCGAAMADSVGCVACLADKST